MAILILSFFIFMNCVGFLLMYMDKQRAKKENGGFLSGIYGLSHFALVQLGQQ